jgi:glycosyltransferase involved in cell wall biosynthesis
MKIAFVSDAVFPYMRGGKEKRLYEISTRLARQGNDVHIYTMHWWNTPDKSISQSGVTLHAISKKYDMYHDDRRSIREGIYFGFASLKMINKKFDIVDVDHMPFFPILGVWFVCMITGQRKKFYATWHEALTKVEWLQYMGKMGVIASAIENICIRLPFRITAASEHTKQHLQKKIDPNRIRVVTSGLDLGVINSVKASNQKHDVVSICRLVKDKNIDILVRSIAFAKKKRPKISCLIIGMGPEKTKLIRLTKQLKLEKNIEFIDSVPENSELYSKIKSSNVFCLPSTREGFGIVVLEALGCGVPVITTDASTNASKQFIENGINGSVTRLDRGLLANHILFWIKYRMTKRGNKIINLAEYDWDFLAKKQFEVYKG